MSPLDGRTLLFMHVPKTAGTSIRFMLDGVFAKPQTMYIYGEPPGISEAELEALPAEEKERLKLILGHFHFGIHTALPQPSRYVTMLREPVDRLVSLYYMYKNNPGSVHHRRITEKSLSLEGFVTSGLFMQADNEMVRQISGVKGLRFGQCSADHLDLAFTNIETHFEAVLIMEHMERSMAKLAHVVGATLPSLGTQNRAASREPVLEIDPAVVAGIRDLNRFDIELYTKAIAAFESD